MTITDEDQEHHVMLGEAAMSLIFSRQEISPAALLHQLQVMAVDEDDDDRLLQIAQTRKWLVTQKNHHAGTPSKNAVTASDSQNDPESRGADNRPRSSQSDEAEK
ncbi:hypothetical protein ABEI22_05580 [Erwinia billingiae]|nr:hypothetical protein [Erwinia billingiae]